MRTLGIALGASVLALNVAAVGARPELSKDQLRRVDDAANVLKDIRAAPDKDIPQDMWDRAECVIVIPSLKKAAFIIGGEYGKGLMSCRHGEEWSAPVFMEMGKGSWGFQAGAESVDLVLLVMNENGVHKMLDNRVTLGVGASVAAGPVGRTAQAATDAQLKAEVLSYSRAQGLFAGVDISGGVLRPDKEDNAALYGERVGPAEVVGGQMHIPAVTEPFMASLRAQSAAR